MSSSKEKIFSKAVAIQHGDAPIRASKLPAFLPFPLLVLLSLTLSSLLYSFVAEYMEGDLASVARKLDQWHEVGAMVGWRTFELGLGWFGGYDGYDLFALSLLSHGPPLYLLAAFYDVRLTTVLSSLLIDSITIYVPFRLLRPLSPAHAASAEHGTVPNREIVTDFSIQVYVEVLAAGIYSVTLYGAYASYLPVYLVTYFSGIPSIAIAHTATLITLFPIALALGLAAKTFIFTPAVTASTKKVAPVDTEETTLSETFWYNVWGFSERTRVVIKRTAALMLVSGVNTFVHTFVTMDGVEATGAAAYAAVWVLASGLTGLAVGIVSAA
ncbi:hypothetical protein D0Z07_6247 [Hyphodiscus hymeniophilus]|uniref:Uncharacterized protein n=1 Tax=Hyphodiscus hymeniophilus TaxID=353542 RepID=A0A9P6VFH6_9HELO|nr:hypothetical protein D0Z07_6247 [Hyphodiscus hymeniophilus]